MSDDEEESNEVYVIDQEMKRKIDRIYDAIWIGSDKPSLMMRVSALEGKMALITWVGAALGLLVIGLIWAILTHQVTVVYP